MPAAVSVLPLIVKIDTEPSLRLAVNASVPDGLIDTPVTPAPACNVWVTAGGLAFRSMTEMRSSGAVFFGSAGSTFMAEVTIAKLSSFETATLCGTPTTLLGAWTSPSTFGGETPMSRMVTVSGGGLAGTMFAPSTSAILLSFAETAICAVAADESIGRASTHVSAVPRMRSRIICSPPEPGYRCW